MTEFTILLSDRDTDLLFSLKQQRGYNSMSGNEFAQQLLQEALHREARENSFYRDSNH